METLCPSVESSDEAARDQLTLGGILRAFLPLLLHLLNFSGHKLRSLLPQAFQTQIGSSLSHLGASIMPLSGTSQNGAGAA